MRNKLASMAAGAFLAKEWAKEKALAALTKKRRGIDGILVTVGLCIIALLICIAMRDQMIAFVNQIIGELTAKASNILGGS